jgi:carbonic anhydrase
MLARLVLAVVLLAPALSFADEHAAHSGPTAEAVLKDLKEGNARFVSGQALHPNDTPVVRAKLADGQKPKAAILGCADSRVPPELVFDEGLGDLFVVRTAGNVTGPMGVGSIEYAAEHLGVPLVVVLGHHRCGAVKATTEANGHAEGNIGEIVKAIAPAVAQAKAAPAKEGLVDDAVHVNARRTAESLTERSPLLKKLVAEGKVKIAVAVYDLATGKVEFE